MVLEEAPKYYHLQLLCQNYPFALLLGLPGLRLCRVLCGCWGFAG